MDTFLSVFFNFKMNDKVKNILEKINNYPSKIYNYIKLDKHRMCLCNKCNNYIKDLMIVKKYFCCKLSLINDNCNCGNCCLYNTTKCMLINYHYKMLSDSNVSKWEEFVSDIMGEKYILLTCEY